MRWFKTNKSPYQVWRETYKPLMGPFGEPMNYIEIIKKITDMTEVQKGEYIDEKVRKNLLWTVVDIGEGKNAVLPGKQEQNAVAWWICDVPYMGTPNGVEIATRPPEC